MTKKFNTYLNSGFTLIELLVVIAIIGLLSAIILASLDTARVKGADAAIKSNLDNVRQQAELFYDSNGNRYVVTAGAATDVCAPTGSVLGVRGAYENIYGAGTALGGTPVIGVNSQAFVYNSSNSGVAGAVVCHSSANAWAAISSLKNPKAASSGWCIDSSGNAKEATVLSAGSFVCGT